MYNLMQLFNAFRPAPLISIILPGVLILAAVLPDERQTIAQEIETALTAKQLHVWYPRAVDRQDGGFLTSFTYDWKPTGSQDKMIVTQARHVWTNAKAAQQFPEVAHYRKSAAQGFRFLREKMWDGQYGGFYTWVTREGKPRADELKTAYGNAFGIYALAAHYQQSGDTAALQLARQAFAWLETHSHDPQYGGYFQHLARDGTPVKTRTGKQANKEIGYKDQNSSIHLLEAFTELYSVWPDSLLRERLQEMLTLIRDTIVTDKGNLTLFLTPDWQPVSYRDSVQAIREANYQLDHVSFGHDVETAYLMLEASHTLGLKHDSVTLQVAKRMTDHALATGWDAKTGGFYERGYYFKDKPGMTIIEDRKNWWAQAEGLNTLLLMADMFPDDQQQYFDKFRRQWQYIQQYLIDQQHGGWYEGGLDKEPERKTGAKAHAWKAAYHDTRALLGCLHRLRPDTLPPAAPKQLNVQQTTKNQVSLQWQAAADNTQLLGYDIYQQGKRIGFTPLTRLSLPVTGTVNPADFAVIAKDLQGNPSPPARVQQ